MLPSSPIQAMDWFAGWWRKKLLWFRAKDKLFDICLGTGFAKSVLVFRSQFFPEPRCYTCGKKLDWTPLPLCPCVKSILFLVQGRKPSLSLM